MLILYKKINAFILGESQGAVAIFYEDTMKWHRSSPQMPITATDVMIWVFKMAEDVLHIIEDKMNKERRENKEKERERESIFDDWGTERTFIVVNVCGWIALLYLLFPLSLFLSCVHYTSQCSGSKSVRTFVVVMVTVIKSWLGLGCWESDRENERKRGRSRRIRKK